MASYSAVIDLRVNGLDQLREIEDRVKAVQNIQKRLKPIPSIFDRRASAEVKAAKEELSQYVKEVAQGKAAGSSFSKTLAGLNAQMRAFNTVAANANAGGEDFVNAITAAERASRQLTEAEIARLQVLNRIYTQQQGIGRTTATQEIINLGKIIPKSIAGLELYEQQLREAQRQALSGSSDYRALAEAIAEVNRQLDIARGIGPIQGPALPPGFTEAGATGFPRSSVSARPKAPQAQGAKTLANVALGAGFPLLFGGGPGAVLGGALGGFAPTPMAFAAQIIFSALGQGLDKFGAAAIEAGRALRTLDTAIEHMGEKALFSSKQQEFAVKKLEEYGRFSIAATLAQSRLNEIVGVEGVNNLQKLGSETEKLNKAWATFSLNLQNVISSVMIPAIQFLNSILSGPREKTGLKGPGTFVGKASLLGSSVPKPAKTPVAIKLSEEQIAQNISAARDLYVELTDLERELNNKKRQYAEQYADMVLALSRQQYDLTEQLERKATDIRIETFRKELDLLKQQADLQVEIARNALLGQQLGAAPGTSLATGLRSALEEYKIRRDEIDNNAADKERRFKLEMVRLDIENERYKLDIAKTIQRTNYDNAVKIARVNEEIARQNDAVSRKNYERRVEILSVELAVLRGQTIQLYAQADAALKQSNLTKDEVAYFETLKNGLVQVLKGTSEIQARQEAGALFKGPGALPQMGALPALSADTTGIDAANDKLVEQENKLNKLATVNEKLVQQDRARLELLNQIDQIAVQPINNIVEGLKDQIEYQKQYTAEIQKGTVTGLAKELASIQALYEPALALLNIEIDRLLAKQANVGLTEKELEILTALDNRRAKLNEAQYFAVDLAKTKGSERSRLQEAITQVKGELNDLTDPINQVVAAADAIGTAFADSFKGIISGAMTAQEALASFFQSLADHFLDMAAQIIAKWIQMTILNSVLQLFPGGSTGTSSNGMFGKGAPTDTFAGGGIFSGAGPYKFPGKAMGGPVSAGSPYIVGERGPELFVPGRSGTIVPNDQMGGSKVEVGTINISVENTGEQLSPAAQKQIANQVQGIVMSTLVNERRSGGVLR